MLGNVLGSHVYPEEGTYTLTVQLADDGGSSVTLSNRVTVTDAPLTATGLVLQTVEGQSFSGSVATFSDQGSDAASYTASIQWGDGSSSSGTVSGNSILGSHVYLEEGTYSVSVRVFDDGGSSVTALALTQVADAPLTLAVPTLLAVEGQTASGVVATFTDAGTDAASYSAVVEWGDGTASAGTVSTGGLILGNHTYAEEGTYSVTVEVLDDGGATASATGGAVVADAAVTASGISFSTAEGQTFSGLVATFADIALTFSPTAQPGAGILAFQATVAWGDGSTQTALVSSSGICASHQYSEEGNYTFTVTVLDPGGSSATVTGVAAVSDVALRGWNVALSQTEGAGFSGLVALFADPGSSNAAGYSATINWGDGSSSSGTVSGTSVYGQHGYLHVGTYTALVTVAESDDPAGPCGLFSGSVTVGDPMTVTQPAWIPGGVTLSLTEGQSFSGTLADFTGRPAICPTVRPAWTGATARPGQPR